MISRLSLSHYNANRSPRAACSSAICIALPLFLLAAPLWASQTIALFGPSSLNIGPFPTDVLAVADSAQKTGERINLPSSAATCDPVGSRSVCSNVSLLNQLDGFNVNPRLMVCFSAPIDPTTLQSGISFYNLAGTSPVAINQTIYDPGSNCAFAKPNQVLAEQSRYLLVVNDSIRDANGNPVIADAAFQNCKKARDPYCSVLSAGLDYVGRHFDTGNIVNASLFTTMSATTWLEQAEQFVDRTELPVVLPAGLPFNFQVADIKSLVWSPDYGTGTAPAPQAIDLSALTNVGRVAFGLYLSPNFLNLSGPAAGTISTTPTNGSFPRPVAGPAAPLGYNTISFHVFLPATPAPPGGISSRAVWPWS